MRSRNPSVGIEPTETPHPGPPGVPRFLDGTRVLMLLGVYFTAHLFIRLAISSTLTLDEAEQVLLGQWFQWGYSGQPPLYAWVQHLVFGLLGRNLFAQALLKNGLLFLAYWFFWMTARRLWPGQRTLVSLAVLSWLFLPQLVWEAQRDLSHSVMVLTMASASLYVVARALTTRGPESRSGPATLWYVAYGVLMGLGMLSKYNFVVFAGALNLALLCLPEGRALLLKPRMLVGLGCAFALCSPHFAWAAGHAEVAARSLSKVEASIRNNRIVGIWVLFVAVVSFLTPLWVAWLGFFPGLFKKSEDRGKTVLHRLIQAYLVVLATGLTFGVLVLGVAHVKERWMLPVLFLLPLFFFSGAEGSGLGPGRVRWFSRLAMAVAFVALLASGSRAILGPTLGVTTRVNYPFDEVARELSEAASQDPHILTHNAWFAGNLLKRFPGARGYVPGFVLPDPVPETPVLVVWDAVRNETLPEEIREDLTNRFGLDPTGMEPEYLVLPYKFGAGREARVAYLTLGGPPS